MPDYSCYITVQNNSKYDLFHKSDQIVDGHLNPNPPGKIAAGQSGSWRLQDNPGPHGSEGTTVYGATLPNGVTVNITLHYSCPIFASNVFTGSSSNPLIISCANSSSGTSGNPLTATTIVSSSAFAKSGLLGYIPADIGNALQSNGDDKAVWDQAFEHLEKMKNAERWGPE